MLPYLEKDNQSSLRREAPSGHHPGYQGELDQDLLVVLLPTAFIEGQASKVTQTKRRLADREAQNTLDTREESTK